MNDYSRNIFFTSTNADYELLTDSNIRTAIKTRLNITNNEVYNVLLANGISSLGFCVFADTRLSINDEPYANNEAINHVVNGDGKINTALIKSIKVENANVVGTFYFRIG